MQARKLLISLALFGSMAFPTTTAHALQVKASINFGPTVTGPDDGTLIVTANPGDLLIITWALGTDASIIYYRGFVSGVDTTEISRVGGSALELTGQGFDPGGNPNFPDTEQFYDAWSDGAPEGFAGNDGELWRLEYMVTAPLTDPTTDMTYTIGPDGCFTFTPGNNGRCPGTSQTNAVSASLRVDVVPEPSTMLLFGLGMAGLAGFGRRTSS